jgi:glutaminyl-tRNA synthetase
MEDPPRKFWRLGPGREVRLRHAYVVKCEEVVKDPSTGEIVEVRCSHDPETLDAHPADGRRIRGTVHWVSASHAVPCEVRLYDRLFRVPDPDDVPESGDFTDHLNPESLVLTGDAVVEPSVTENPPGTRFQFERQGYFVSDAVDSRPDRPVFNRTVSLRDTWAKIAARG